MQNYLTSEQYAFIMYLTSLTTENNRGELAVMRRGLMGAPCEDLNLYRFVARRVPESDRDTYREAAYYLVAALYALHPVTTNQGNFGDHMKQVAGRRKDSDAAERRFTALLNARLEDIAAPLRQAMTMLKGEELPVNWLQLFSDLLHWSNPKKVSQRAWANGFWAYERPEDETAENQPVAHS